MHARQPWVLSGMCTHSETICPSFYGLVRLQVRRDVTRHFNRPIGNFPGFEYRRVFYQKNFRSSSIIIATLFLVTVPFNIPIDVSSPHSWLIWKAWFLRFRSLTKLDEGEEPRQISTLLYTMGAEANHIFEVLPLMATARKQWDDVMKAPGNYFRPVVNAIHQRTISSKPPSSPRTLSGAWKSPANEQKIERFSILS